MSGDRARELVDGWPQALTDAARAALVARIAPALAAHPGTPITVVRDRLVAALGDEDVLATLPELHVDDLVLVAGVLANRPEAIRAVDALIAREAPLALRSYLGDDQAIAETIQELRAKLLTADGADRPPRVAGYLGLGPLAGWIKVAALRQAVSARRKLWRERPLEEALLETDDVLPSARELLARREVKAELASVLAAAFAAQPARTRAILRMYYADGADLDDIGRVYHVHESTISRWLARAREDIARATRKELARRLGLDPSSVESLLRSALSVELSLPGLLVATRSD